LAVIIAAVPMAKIHRAARRGITHVATKCTNSYKYAERESFKLNSRILLSHKIYKQATIYRGNMLLDMKLRRITNIRAGRDSTVHVSRDSIGVLVNVDSQMQKSTSNEIETRSRTVSNGAFHPLAGA